MNRTAKTAAILALGLAAGAVSAAVAGAEEVWRTLPFPTAYPEAPASGYAEVNGVRIFHAEWGAGDPVILLHGGLGSIEAFANQIPVLASGHRVIAIDSRGHGRSTRDATPYSYALMASDVLAVMDGKAIDTAAFVGWSDGGIIALELAINHPQRISRALVLGANYTLDGIDPAVDTDPVFSAYVEAAAALYADISPTPDGFDGFVEDIVGMWSTQPSYTEAELATVTAPFTVVQALHDEAILDAHAEKMAALLPGATYLPMDGVSHFALWQDPDRLNAAILAFLE